MKVALLKPHTHAGEQKNAGDTIEVDADTAQWLAGQGVIEPLPTPVIPAKAGIQLTSKEK